MTESVDEWKKKKGCIGVMVKSGTLEECWDHQQAKIEKLEKERDLFSRNLKMANNQNKPLVLKIKELKKTITLLTERDDDMLEDLSLSMLKKDNPSTDDFLKSRVEYYKETKNKDNE